MMKEQEKPKAPEKETPGSINTKSKTPGKTTEETYIQNKGFFSLDSLKNLKILPEWIKHLATGAGAIGGSYYFFIKPLREKFDKLYEHVKTQDTLIDSLQEQINRLEEKQRREPDREERNYKGENELFVVRNRIKEQQGTGSQRKVRF